MKNNFFLFVAALTALLAFSACKEDKELTEWDVVGGKWNKTHINALVSFHDRLPGILSANQFSYSEYILMSTDSAWAYPEATRMQLKNLRESAPKPTAKTLFQKFISLSEMDRYINNVDGGCIDAYVVCAADVKSLYKMSDIYRGLRLDYDNSPFKPDAAGYAAIRFYTDKPERIQIPYCQEMGGSHPHSWPDGGGGFSASTLGKGGYPIWYINEAIEPMDGAELYEMNANGYEILRAVFDRKKKWQIVDRGYSPLLK